MALQQQQQHSSIGMDSQQQHIIVQQLQNAIELWTSKVQYDVLIQNMNTNITDVFKVQKDQSIQSRKVLAETTKGFKKSVKTAEQAVVQLTTVVIPTNNDNNNNNNKETNHQSVIDNVITSMESLSNECRSTIKLYQEEIDTLTRRCKNVEQEYTTIYNTLQLSDGTTTTTPTTPTPTITTNPVTLLQHCYEMILLQNQQITQLVSSNEALHNELETSQQMNMEYKMKNEQLVEQVKNATSAAAAASTISNINNNNNNSSSNSLSNDERDELITLRKEVAEYELEFRSLKNQDITIRKLEEKVQKLQMENEENIRTSIESVKEEMIHNEQERIAELVQQETTLLVQIQSLELQLRTERTSREMIQSNLHRVDDHIVSQQNIWDVQRNILLDDNTRIRELLHTITRERDELLHELSIYKPNNIKSTITTITNSDGTVQLRSPPSSMGISSNKLDGTNMLSTSTTTNTTNITTAAGTGGVVSFQDLLLERNAYEAEVSELSEMNIALREEIRQKEEQHEQEIRTLQTRVELYDREKVSLQNTITSLEVQLSSAPSRSMIDTMKRELRILKRLEYNATDEDDENNNNDDIDESIIGRDPEVTTTSGHTTIGNVSDENNLERVLVAKLRHAEKELITERNIKTELQQQITSLQQSLTNTEQAKMECEQLIISLENDLQRAITQAASISTPTTTTLSKKSIQPSTSSIDEQRAASTLQHILDPSAPQPPPPPQMSSPSSKSITEKVDDDHSVATIVMAQRDRLRARCDALEAERDSFKRELQCQVQASESLKTDNTKLYEKVRYLQNYNNINKGGGVGSNNKGGNIHQRSMGLDRDLDLEALEQRYEASVDPFKQFSKSERQRKLNEMSPMERAVFIVAKTVLSTKEMRTGLFFYVLTLHLLVFATTYNWSHGTAGGCDLFSASEHLAHLPPVKPKNLQQQQQLVPKQVVAKEAASVIDQTDPIIPN